MSARTPRRLNHATGPRTVEMVLHDLIGSTTPAGCWRWLGQHDKQGYAYVRIGRQRYRAHRYVFESFGVAIPDGLVLDHLCRNRWCVNPAHLEIVTAGENTLRGIGPTAINDRKTHCWRGHEFTAENTAYNASGSRVCRECTRQRHRVIRARPTSLLPGDERHGSVAGYRRRCRCQPCRDAWAAYRRAQRTAA